MCHLTPHTLAAGEVACSWQVYRNLPIAEEWIFGKNMINFTHQFSRIVVEANGSAIQRRSTDPEQPALQGQTQSPIVSSDHGFAFRYSHRFNPYENKSFSTANLPILGCRSLICVSLFLFLFI